MSNFFERGFLATVGLLSLSREKSQELVDELVKRGDINRDEGRHLVERLVSRGLEEQETLRKLVRNEVQAVLSEFNLATRSDLQSLEAKIDALTQQIEQSSS
jgi:polyhydroxyalkanoate synthesis regulator phasin